MSSADRVSQLIDQWLISLELHLNYTQLSDLAYACVQPWPKHERPTRWVVQIAREKLLQLKQHCDTRRAAGDEQFAEALELMLTLSNLVGLQHIQRFIPLADPERANPAAQDSASASPDFDTLLQTANAAPDADPALIEPTRELPQLKVKPVTPKPARPASAARTPPATAPSSAPVRTVARVANVATKTHPVTSVAVSEPATPVTQPLSAAERIVIADAIRLLKWGKPWHELAELVSRIADRPGITQVRRILRTHRPQIEARVGASATAP